MFARSEPRTLDTIVEVPYITTRADPIAKTPGDTVAPVGKGPVGKGQPHAQPWALVPGVGCTTVLLVLAALVCFWAAEPVTSTQYAAFLLLAAVLACHVASVWVSYTGAERGKA